MKVYVTAHPGSNRNLVTAIDETHYEIFVTAFAQQNRANLAVIECLAEYFHVAKSLISIKRGATSKKKVVEIVTNLPLKF